MNPNITDSLTTSPERGNNLPYRITHSEKNKTKAFAPQLSNKQHYLLISHPLAALGCHLHALCSHFSTQKNVGKKIRNCAFFKVKKNKYKYRWNGQSITRQDSRIYSLTVFLVLFNSLPLYKWCLGSIYVYVPVYTYILCVCLSIYISVFCVSWHVYICI